MQENFLGQVTQKAVLKYKDFFVLVKEKNEDRWILPGGRLDFGEKPEDGLLREIKEELGVEAIVENIISVDLPFVADKGKTPKFFVFYFVSVLPNQKILIDSEISDFVLVSQKEDLKKYPMYENQKKVIENFLNE
ncbi:MAG: NUDIX hydrolase [bacterium]